MPTFTWPLLGIGRPENLEDGDKPPPLIIAVLLAPAIYLLLLLSLDDLFEDPNSDSKGCWE
jgi:hypothetical protein